ncbi:MAG: hypothetical protein AABY06_02760 [Nanoarchaeota archaeon]
MIEHKLNSDYMNEFTPLRLLVTGIEEKSLQFKSLTDLLKKYPLRTYEERAKIYDNYDLENADKEVIQKLDKYVKEINEKVSKNTLKLDRIKQLVDESYLTFYGEKAFK